MPAPTKARLQEIADDQAKRIKELKGELQDAQREHRQARTEANRESSSARDYAERLRAIRTVIQSALKTKHNTNVEPEHDVYRGQYIEVEESTEAVRLLRHLYDIANTDPPF